MAAIARKLLLVKETGTVGGVRSIDRPERWVVPPWPEDAELFGIVKHFALHDPQWCCGFAEADVHAFYVAFAQALEAVTDIPTDDALQRWYRDLRASITACVHSTLHNDPHRAGSTRKGDCR